MNEPTPAMCGYDGDGDVWIERCDAVPEPVAASRYATASFGGKWTVVGRTGLPARRKLGRMRRRHSRRR
jgi:hypothetical protein